MTGTKLKKYTENNEKILEEEIEKCWLPFLFQRWKKNNNKNSSNLDLYMLHLVYYDDFKKHSINLFSFLFSQFILSFSYYFDIILHLYLLFLYVNLVNFVLFSLLMLCHFLMLCNTWNAKYFDFHFCAMPMMFMQNRIYK